MQRGALFHGNKVTKLKGLHMLPQGLCVPLLGVIYALLCGIMLPNGIDSQSKEAWGGHKYHTGLCL